MHHRTGSDALIFESELDGSGLDVLAVFRFLSARSVNIRLSDPARARVVASRNYIEEALRDGALHYGVNTGFGAFSSVRISESEIAELQVNLIRSHSCGIGEPLPLDVVKVTMLLRANTLARGHSGVRAEVIEKLLEFMNSGIFPVIPSQGSVGASGDLAPLSHLALALIGEGEVWHEGRTQPTVQVLAKLGIAPLVLQAKEGLSLINGCQVMTAIGLVALLRATEALKYADLAAAMTIEATRGSRKAFHPLIAATRPHPAEARTAEDVLRLLGQRSAISDSHDRCSRVQDAYSLRCVPAVHGAVKHAIDGARRTLEIEANSSTDNPLVFAEDREILSCGNFHGEPVALAMDFAAIAMANLGNISERRIAKLIDPDFSDLPAFLISNGGLQSGFMIVQVAAASLVSENKILAHPASVDSIPTSADKEDHVSMGAISARKFQKIVDHVRTILAMEILAAAQGLDLLKPLEAAAGVKAAHACIRRHISFAENDRVFSEDIARMVKLMDSDELLTEVENAAAI